MKKMLLALFAAISVQCGAETLVGKIIHLEDGDTMSMRTDAAQNVTIRVEYIDSPESCHQQHDASCARKPGQPFGRRATEEMKRLALGKRAVAECQPGEDPYRRRICNVLVNDESVGLRLVADGFAWLYRVRRGSDYVIQDKIPAHVALENAAREQKRGLWSLPNPVYPGMWRRLCWEGGNCIGKGDN